MPTVS